MIEENYRSIHATTLKQGALMMTGRQVYGLDEYIYMTIPKFNDREENIKIKFFVFIQDDYGNYLCVDNHNKGEWVYYIQNDKPMVDSSGFYVYGEDQWGDITYGQFRTNDYNVFKSLEKSEIKDYMSQHILEWMGYHENEGGTLDMLNMFGDDKIEI